MILGSANEHGRDERLCEFSESQRCTLNEVRETMARLKASHDALVEDVGELKGAVFGNGHPPISATMERMRGELSVQNERFLMQSKRIEEVKSNHRWLFRLLVAGFLLVIVVQILTRALV